MNFKKTHEVIVRNPEEYTEEETKAKTKMAKVVKAPSDILLEGEEIRNAKPRGKVVKGGNNEFINRQW